MTVRMIILPALFILMLGIAALAVWLYNRYYRRQINRALEEDAPIGPTPEPRHAGKVVLFLLIAFCLVLWEFHKNDKLNELNQTLISRTQMLSEQIEGLKWELDNQIQEANSNFLAFDYEMTDPDVPTRTVNVTFTAVPKQASTDATVTLRYGGESLPLSRDKTGIYTASVKMNLFQLPDTDSATLCLTENGREQNEAVELWLDPVSTGLFPCIKGNLDVETLDLHENSFTLRASLASVWCTDSAPKQLRLLVKQNDKVVDEQDLTNWDDGITSSCTLDGEYPLGTTFWLRWEDSFGLIHEAGQFGIDENGDEIAFSDVEQIYDADGTFLGAWDSCFGTWH